MRKLDYGPRGFYEEFWQACPEPGFSMDDLNNRLYPIYNRPISTQAQNYSSLSAVMAPDLSR